VKALTVQQPWAWAIIHGGKDVENRTQAWSYRGPLAIHAGARWSERGAHSTLVSRAVAEQASRECEHFTGNPIPPLAISYMAEIVADQGLPDDPDLFGKGALIGLVDLVDVHHQVGSGDRNDCCESPWAETWYHGRGSLVHIELANPRPLESAIPCVGRLGLWTPATETLEQLQALAMSG
jgi:hypothetical protein